MKTPEPLHETLPSGDKSVSHFKAEEANAALIAAAPELLEACKAVAKLWLDDPREPYGGRLDRLNAAIVKAGGAL